MSELVLGNAEDPQLIGCKVADANAGNVLETHFAGGFQTAITGDDLAVLIDQDRYQKAEHLDGLG